MKGEGFVYIFFYLKEILKSVVPFCRPVLEVLVAIFNTSNNLVASPRATQSKKSCFLNALRFISAFPFCIFLLIMLICVSQQALSNNNTKKPI